MLGFLTPYFIFQSTLPREERRYTLPEKRWTGYFNPRSHERSDRGSQQQSDSGMISIHAPTRGATHLLCFLKHNTQHFNPRSHERSDSHVYVLLLPPIISIHAPTRGATHDIVNRVLYAVISIHAPTRGATRGST